MLTDRGELIKFNFAGYREWSTQTKKTSLSSPASDGDVIIFGNQAGELLIVSVKTGEINSKTKFNYAITGGLSIENGNAYFADETGALYSFNIKNKKVNWTANTGTKILSTPVMDDSKIYIGNLGGNLFAFDKNNGKKIWEISTLGVINTTPLITRNMIIQPDVNKKVYFLNSSDGEIEKTLAFERRTKLNPVFYDSLLYLGSDRGIIHAYYVYGNN